MWERTRKSKMEREQAKESEREQVTVLWKVWASIQTKGMEGEVKGLKNRHKEMMNKKKTNQDRWKLL